MEEILAPIQTSFAPFTASSASQAVRDGHVVKGVLKTLAEDGGGSSNPEDEVTSGGARVGQPVAGQRTTGLNLGLAFALQRKRAMRAIRRLARMAQIRLPLPEVRTSG
jgi:hypothetical protein